MDKTENKSSELNSKIFDVHKMVFIYNALKNGWTVKMRTRNSFVFTKNRNERIIDSDEFHKKFLIENLHIEPDRIYNQKKDVYDKKDKG